MPAVECTQVFDKRSFARGIRSEERVVGVFHRTGSIPGDSRALGSYVHASSPAVTRVGSAFYESSAFKSAKHLRHHHRVGADLLTECCLRQPVRVVVPGKTRKKHKLNVRDAMRAERFSKSRLPAIRHAPQQESWAVMAGIETAAEWIVAHRVIVFAMSSASSSCRGTSPRRS